MRTLRLYMTMTCDGCFAGPGGELGWMAAAHPAASAGEHAIADAVNRVHSLVLSRTAEKVPWDNAELLVVRDDDDLREAVNAAKHQSGRDIGVPGGIRTARTFARLGLIDEYVFMMHPVALGEGQRIFRRLTHLELHSVKAYRSGVTRLIYQPRAAGGTAAGPGPLG